MKTFLQHGMEDSRVLDRTNHDFVDLCLDISDYAHERKRGLPWFYLCWARDEKDLMRRLEGYYEDGGYNPLTGRVEPCTRNPVKDHALALIASWRASWETMDTIVEGMLERGGT